MSLSNDQAAGSAPRWATTLVEPLSALAFWSAIGLPLLYLPLLVAGLGSVQDLLVFLGLFGLHLVSLVVGRSYRSR